MVTSHQEETFPSGPGQSGRKEELALHVLHSLSQPICILDADDCYLFANKAYANLYGVGLDLIRGMCLRDLMGEPLYAQRMVALLERARRDGASEFRGWMDYPESGRRFMEADIRSYASPGLAEKQCLILQLRDVTDRAELDQRRRKSLEFQEELMAQVPAMLWISGPDGTPYFYNESWLEFTGSTLVEQIREGWISMVAADDRQQVMDRIRYAQLNQESVHLEFRLRYLMGGYRWVRLVGQPVNGGIGDKDHFIASAVDIDEIKVREEKMRAALEEERHLREQALLQKAAADRANREKSAYLSLASHEIRTPMNPVIGFADLLASNPNLDGDSKEMAQMILKAGKNLLTLIDEVLDYAKIEAGALQLAPEPMDVHDLLIEIDNLYAFDAKSRGIELRINDRVRAEGELFQDRLRLQQVLSTLVINAIKFTHTGFVELQAETEEVDIGDGSQHILRFRIIDSGVGMEADEVEKLFKPFARPETEFSDKYAGAGLGLAITQKLVTAMRGEVSVQSVIGKGTTVELVIPYDPVPEHLRPALQRHEPDDRKPEKKPQASIIIVDDEESSRQVNVSLMKFLGYACDVARNGEELMQRLGQRSYQMIMLDIMMPGLDGFEVTRRIRNGDCGEGNREAYIVAVTACSDEEDRSRGARLGINAYLTKPLTIQALRDTVRSYHELGRPTPTAV